MRGLAVRRHDHFRMRDRAKQLLSSNRSFSEKWIDKAIRVRGDTYTVCSCSMCCNPRRSEWNKKGRLQVCERRVLESEGSE